MGTKGLQHDATHVTVHFSVCAVSSLRRPTCTPRQASRLTFRIFQDPSSRRCWPGLTNPTDPGFKHPFRENTFTAQGLTIPTGVRSVSWGLVLNLRPVRPLKPLATLTPTTTNTKTVTTTPFSGQQARRSRRLTLHTCLREHRLTLFFRLTPREPCFSGNPRQTCSSQRALGTLLSSQQARQQQALPLCSRRSDFLAPLGKRVREQALTSRAASRILVLPVCSTSNARKPANPVRALWTQGFDATGAALRRASPACDPASSCHALRLASGFATCARTSRPSYPA